MLTIVTYIFDVFAVCEITLSVLIRLGHSWACLKGNFAPKLTVVKNRSQPVTNGCYGPVFFRSFISEIERPGPMVRSFPVRSGLVCGLFAVLGPDF